MHKIPLLYRRIEVIIQVIFLIITIFIWTDEEELALNFFVTSFGIWQFGISNTAYLVSYRHDVSKSRKLYTVFAVLVLLVLAYGWSQKDLSSLFFCLFMGPALALLYFISSCIQLRNKTNEVDLSSKEEDELPISI